MKKLPILLIAGTAIIAAELLAGIAFLTYGVNYVRVDEESAEEMLAFISENNPEFYERIQNGAEPSYRAEFYKNYTEKGNRTAIVAGLMMILIAAGNAAVLGAVFLGWRERDGKRNRIDLTGKDGEGEEDRAADEKEADSEAGNAKKEKVNKKQADKGKKQQPTNA